MTASLNVARLSTALIAAAAATILVSGVALAHPESESEHPGGCVVSVEPGSVMVGQQFIVAGNFGGAQIFVVEGADASPAEDATPAATTEEGGSFSVTFTAEAGDIGEHTVWAFIPGSECGDSDGLTVTALIPDTATELPSDQFVFAGAVLLLAGTTLGSGRFIRSRR